MDSEQLFKEPVVGLPIYTPDGPIQPGSKLIGYRVINTKGYFTKPKPSRLTATGWVCIILLGLVFWPISCLPCITTCSYPEAYQVPVYELPEV